MILIESRGGAATVGFLIGLFWFVVVCLGLIALCYLVMGIAFVGQKLQNPKRPSSAGQVFSQHLDDVVHGNLNSTLICPHCQTRGQVRTKAVDEKKGISGGKATAALLTGGVSMVATGLSRKEKLTRALCGQCKSTWTF